MHVVPKTTTQSSSSKPAPPVAKKPAGYSSVTLQKPPPSPSEEGRVDVRTLARKLSSEKLPKKVPEETAQEGQEGGSRPAIPERINSCFEKQDQAVSVGPKPRERSNTLSNMPAPTPHELNWLPTGESMTLTELASTHSSRFPLRIHLLDGYYGQTSRFTLSSSDIFDIHFAKRKQVLSVRDSSGVDYSIPLNSAIQFGLIHGQILPKSRQEIVKMVHSTVQDLLSLDPLPKMVCAMSSWSKPSDKEGKEGVEEKELLIVKGVFKSRLRSKRALKVVSLKTQTKKLLPEECEGNFSIDPEATRLHVYEFSLKQKAHFPCKAMMFLGSDRKSDPSVFRSVPKSLLKKPISVLKVVSEVSLAATSVSNKQSPPLDPKVARIDFQRKPIKKVLTMEIPLDSHLGDIEAEILQAPNEEETEKLYMNTKELLQKANKEPYMILLDKGSDRVNDTQSMLYMQVRSENSDLGVTYETSEAIYEKMDASEFSGGYATPRVFGKPTATATHHAAKVDMEIIPEEGDDHEYEDIDRTLSVNSAAVRQLAPTSPSHFSPEHLPPSHLQHRKVFLPESAATQGTKYSTSLPFPATLLSPDPPLPSQSAPYVEMVPPYSVPGKGATMVPPETKRANREFLRSMTEAEVSQDVCVCVHSVGS